MTTSPVDIDALIAEAREADAPEVHAGIIRRLADALEQSLAELRQERERADEASHAAGRHKSDAAEYQEQVENQEHNLREMQAALSPLLNCVRAEGAVQTLRALSDKYAGFTSEDPLQRLQFASTSAFMAEEAQAIEQNSEGNET